MASRPLERHLRLAIVIYVIAFVVTMYIWQNSGTREAHSHAKEEASRDMRFHQHHQISPKDKPEADGHRVLKPDENLLVINAEKINASVAANGPSAVGTRLGLGEVGKGKRKDRSLGSRLVSVFDSILDCPSKLPLTFLGMDNATVDLSQDPACPWIKGSVKNKEGNFVALGEEMAVLRNVTLDPNHFKGTLGGEKIASVFHQNEDSEYFAVKSGFFSLPCETPPQGVRFHVDRRNYRRYNHLNKWLASLTCEDVPLPRDSPANVTLEGGTVSGVDGVTRGFVPGVTLALQRYEYANVYHTMLDWYNVFISVLILGIDPEAATFLVVDGHPWGKLDPTWATLFGGTGVLRAGHLPRKTRFEYLVWVPNGYHCPLFNTERSQVPFLGELREHFFKSYGIRPSPGPNCSKLRMLLIRRHDYLAHPRNPKGAVARKIANEDEVRDALRAAFPDAQVRAEQLDLMTMRQQLDILSQTDVLVGMHGAALTYTALLPKGAALVEMYPKYAGKTSMLFKQISNWRGIHYAQWMNHDSKNEKPNQFTYIPTNVVVDMVTQMKKQMCG